MQRLLLVWFELGRVLETVAGVPSHEAAGPPQMRLCFCRSSSTQVLVVRVVYLSRKVVLPTGIVVLLLVGPQAVRLRSAAPDASCMQANMLALGWWLETTTGMFSTRSPIKA